MKKNNIKSRLVAYVQRSFVNFPTIAFLLFCKKKIKFWTQHACELCFFFPNGSPYYSSNWANLASKAPRIFWMSWIWFFCSSFKLFFLFTFAALISRHFLIANMVSQNPRQRRNNTRNHVPTEIKTASWTSLWLYFSRLSRSSANSNWWALRCSVMVLFNTLI